MDNKRRLVQSSIYHSNQINNNHPVNIYSNSRNINIQKSYFSQNNINKPHNLTSNYTGDIHKTKTINNNNNNNYRINYNSNKRVSQIKDFNTDTRSNYSIQSNSSSNTIRSMLDNININQKSIDEISLKSKNYSDSINSSKISQGGYNTTKYMSTNYNSYNDYNKKNFCVPNIQNQKQMNSITKEKIEKAKLNEEILLPPFELGFDSLNITKPIKIKGQQNSCLIINEGPILIDLEEFNCSGGNRQGTVKFSQLRIIYNDNKINKDKKISTLFKLHPSSLIELEDCDIVFQNNKKGQTTLGPPQFSVDANGNKSVAFVMSSNKKRDNFFPPLNPTLLTLTNTSIHNFYQSIRAGKNCVVNINKSAFIKNYGKPIIMLNPVSLKINETFFQYNSDNSIHLKFIDDCLYTENRKIFITKNDFDAANGNDICIEGIKDNKLDLSIVIRENNFHNNTTDGVLIYDLLYNNLEISNNIFRNNQGNGLNIQKLFFNGVSSKNSAIYQSIKIKENQFIENKGFGLFVNDCVIEAMSNKFKLNKQSGMSLCNIIIDDPQKGYSGINLRVSTTESEQSSTLKSIKKISTLLKNSFYENGESGLFIHGYPYHINIIESVFTNNFRHGISIDLDSLYNNKYGNNHKSFKISLEEFKSSKRPYDLANINLNKCVIEKNMKAGLSINSCLIYCEGTFIMNNIEYAISLKKKDFQHCFKEGNDNLICGSMGGDWGKIDSHGDAACFSCMGGSKINIKKKEEIEKKVPSCLNQSEESNKSSITIDKNYYNYNRAKTKNEEDNGCYIF